jgi:hypothetical protein
MIAKYTKEMAGKKRLSDVTVSNIEIQGKRRKNLFEVQCV